MPRRDDPHIPVLLKPVLRVLDPKPGQTIVDCTVGLGGHALRLAEMVRARGQQPGVPAEGSRPGRLIGIDQDAGNLASARKRLAEGRGTFELFHANFGEIERVLAEAGVMAGGLPEGGVDAVLADIGVASTQIDDPARGFSYRRAGPLDMRMDPTRGESAAALIARLSERELAEAILDLGDEADAPRIARLIVQRRGVRPITTTDELSAIVCEARDFTLERAAGAKLHPAARTFQALRILVNGELENLERLLSALPRVLRPGGIAAIISFHSGEDRRVKHAFREGVRSGVYAAAAEEPIMADQAEVRRNPRAKSAKLRWARRSGEGPAEVRG